MCSPFEFSSSNVQLNEGIAWAKQMALSYVRDTGDPVGPWIESALPGRDAFCMRDVSHMSAGAHVLGLERFISNMFAKFARSIDASRDWAAYWEINKDDLPAPVDYTSDEDFWFNLPANFDVLEACWRAYKRTGDRGYVSSSIFERFYQKTVNEYVQTWDRNNDGLVEGPFGPERRGIPSYEEGVEGFLGAFDLLVYQHDAYIAYAEMMEHLGHASLGLDARAKAAALRRDYETRWWNADEGFFYDVIMKDGKSANMPINMCGRFPRGYVPSREMVLKSLDLPVPNVEGRSYMAEHCYRYGLCDEGLSYLLSVVDPAEPRRGYPEVSYATIGASVEGLLGLSFEAHRGVVRTLPGLGSSMGFAEAKGVAAPGGAVSIRHEGSISTFGNETDRTWEWRAAFYGFYDTANINGEPSQVAPWRETADGGQIITVWRVTVAPGETAAVRL